MTTSPPQPLPPALGKVSLHPHAYRVSHWVIAAGDDELFDLHAPYQRASVWSTEQQQALIKSLLMGVPVGAVIVSVLDTTPGHPVYRVIDGKQRIEAVRAWMAGRLAIPGWWLPAEQLSGGEDARAGAVTWDGLTGFARRLFHTSTPLPALEFDGRREWLGRDSDDRPRWRERTPEEVLRAEAEVFMLVNSAGTAQDRPTLARAAAVAARPAPPASPCEQYCNDQDCWRYFPIGAPTLSDTADQSTRPPR